MSDDSSRLDQKSDRAATDVGPVAVIGAGAMGSALVRGIVRDGVVPPADISVSDPDRKRVEVLASDTGVRVAHGNVDAAKGSRTVLVAVKPALVASVLEQLSEGDALGADTRVVSIAAGVPLRTIEEALPPGVPAIRVMPNTACLVGEAASAVSAGRHASEKDVRAALAVFEAVGRTVVVPEGQLDAVTGVSGSGPAYAYLAIEAMADGAVAAGLPRHEALTLAAQTLRGAATMVLESGKHPGELKDMVVSPAGTTAAGVRELERHGFRGALIEAVLAAAGRAAELGKS